MKIVAGGGTIWRGCLAVIAFEQWILITYLVRDKIGGLGFAVAIAGVKIAPDIDDDIGLPDSIGLGIGAGVEKIVSVLCVDGIGAYEDIDSLVIVHHDVVVDICLRIEVDGNSAARFGRTSSPAVADE